jgi:hypothetical protein
MESGDQRAESGKRATGEEGQKKDETGGTSGDEAAAA